MSTDDRSPEPGPPVPISERWKDPPVFTPIPEGATRQEVLRLRFGHIPPPTGTPERVEWDRLGMDEPGPEPKPEILVPPDTAEYLSLPPIKYPPGTAVEVDGKPIPLGQPGPFDDDQRGGA